MEQMEFEQTLKAALCKEILPTRNLHQCCEVQINNEFRVMLCKE